MVGHVTSAKKSLAIGLISVLMSGSVCALGPQAPFVAPNASSFEVDATAIDGTKSGGLTQGLSGVRVGRYAGAVIDGRWVRKGRSIRGARLIEVRRGSVTLRHPDGRREVLSMFTAQSQNAGTQVPMQKEVVKP